jgi:hypothetical protein
VTTMLGIDSESSVGAHPTSKKLIYSRDSGVRRRGVTCYEAIDGAIDSLSFSGIEPRRCRLIRRCTAPTRRVGTTTRQPLYDSGRSTDDSE